MHTYARLLQYARRQRSHFVLIFVLTLAASALAAAQPWPMKLIVDNVLGTEPMPHWLSSVLGTFHLGAGRTPLLVLLVTGGLLLFVLNSVIDSILTWAWTTAGRRMVYDLAEDLFARLQRRPLLFHSRGSVSDSMSRVTVDCWAVHKVVDTMLFTPVHAVLTMAAMVFFMSRLDTLLTCLAIVTAPLMVGASFLLAKPLRAAARLKRDIELRIQAHIQQTLTGIPVVQAFAQEEREQERFEKFADAAIRAQQRSTLVGSVNTLSSGLVTTLGTGLILYVGARHVMEGRLSLGSLLLFLVYLTSMQVQMKSLTGLYSTMLGLSASTDRIRDALDGPTEVLDEKASASLPRFHGDVEFQNVSFSYQPGQPVLRNISLSARGGEIVALVGSSGAGKTTLVNLLPRFFDPSEGRVTVDGKDLRDLPLAGLRDQVAIVLQEPFLFPVSVAENIAFADPTADRARIEAAARAANAHDFISALPKGYDTVIGERGATLSGGERQRLAIARALLKNAPILVLDEPTSALDSSTERDIIEALERLMAGRTTFIIAHRLSTVRRAHRIVVLERGCIVESGTHEELLHRHGSYWRFHHPEMAAPAGAAAAGSVEVAS